MPGAKRKSKAAAPKQAKKPKTALASKKGRGPPTFVEAPQNENVTYETAALDADAIAHAETFLSGLDSKSISKSRKTIKQEWKRDKGKIHQGPSRTSKILKTVPAAEGEGENMEDLDSDDFALHSGDSDIEGLSDMSDMPDSDSEISDMSSDDGLEDSEQQDDSGSDLPSDFDLTNAYDRDLPSESEEEEEPELDVEEAYEQRQAQKRAPLAPTKPARLPTKLPNGQIQQAESSEPKSQKRKVVIEAAPEESESEQEAPKQTTWPVLDPLGTRFGKLGIRDILQLPSKQERLSAARTEMASLSGDIMADPVNSLNALKRLLALCAETLAPLKSEQSTAAIPIDQAVRALALLSLLAVFLDITPQYRIRELTDAERSSKVSQEVARQRDYENGLVATYKRYLEICEQEVDDMTPLKNVALKCMCDLLKERSAFNFGQTLMDAIARHVSRAEWDEGSVQCLEAIIHIFKNDKNGFEALHLLRALSRIIKSRSFKVHPSLVASFLHLPLVGSLYGVRASRETARKDEEAVRQVKRKLDRKLKTKTAPYVNKKTRKTLKDKKEVEKEIADAELTVSAEELTRTRTETLKLLFALYFRILKLDRKTELLSPALEGLAAFAHLINIDFFKDLLAHLKLLVSGKDLHSLQLDTREQLLCIVTAFQLLSGQGEALNFDLAEFVAQLYSILIPLSLSLRFEERPNFESAQEETTPTSISSRSILASEADLLFKALETVFITARTKNPPSRMIAFAKRILICSLQWPGDSTLRAVDLVRKMLVKEPALESMLEAEDTHLTGVYNGETDELHLASAEATVWWELGTLQDSHYDGRVREAAEALSNFVRNR